MSTRRKNVARFEQFVEGRRGGDNAVLYHRVSTPGQEEGYSLQYQRDKTLALADRLGLVVASEHIFDEVASGAEPRRPLFRRTADLVAAGEVGHVVAYGSTRLSRDPLHLGIFVRHCKDHGVVIHFADGTKVETEFDELVQYFMGFQGRSERARTAAASMDGKRKAAENNRMPNGTGVGMYGYDYDPYTHVRTINDLEAEVLRQMFDWRIEGLSYSAIARKLKELGIRAKRGGDWSFATVRTSLNNPACTGEQVWGMHRYEKLLESENGPKRRVSEKDEDEWIRISGFSPRIIEPVKFAAAKLLSVRRSRKGIEWDYFLTPFFWCGECEEEVAGGTQTADRKKRKYTYVYYRCSGTMGSEYRPKVCDVGGWRADKLEPVVVEHIRAVVENPEGVLEGMRRDMAGDGVGLERRIGALKGQLRKKEIEADTLTLQRTKGLIRQGAYERLLAPMNLVVDRLENELALLIQQKGEMQNKELYEEQVRAVLMRYRANLDSLDGKGLHSLMRFLNIRLTGRPGGVLVTGVLDPRLFTTGQTLA